MKIEKKSTKGEKTASEQGVLKASGTGTEVFQVKKHEHIKKSKKTETKMEKVDDLLETRDKTTGTEEKSVKKAGKNHGSEGKSEKNDEKAGSTMGKTAKKEKNPEKLEQMNNADETAETRVNAVKSEGESDFSGKTGEKNHVTDGKSGKKVKKALVSPKYTVEECGLKARQFGTSREVVLIALREAGRESGDLLTFREAKSLVFEFLRREVL